MKINNSTFPVTTKNGKIFHFGDDRSVQIRSRESSADLFRHSGLMRHLLITCNKRQLQYKKMVNLTPRSEDIKTVLLFNITLGQEVKAS